MPEPPSYLPDFFASEPSPRTWNHVRVTIIGLVLCCFLLGQALLGFLEEPIVSEVEILSTLGSAYATTLKCKNQLGGCIVEHLYDNGDCSAAVAAISTSTTTIIAYDEELVVYLCSSPLWTDGLLIATPLELPVVSSATVEVLSGDMFVGLPPSPLFQVGGNPTAVGVAITTLTDVDKSSEDIIGMSSQLVSASRCPEVDGGSPPVLPGPVSDLLQLCYQLRLEPTATTITNVRSISWLTLLDTWGGVYGFVFGLIGTAFFWIEQVSASFCCGRNDKTVSMAVVTQ